MSKFFCFIPVLCLLSTLASAQTFCVSNATGLKNALSFAQNNSQADTINIVKGTYHGNFKYNSSSTERSMDLTIAGGYSPGCTSQTLNYALTILDGDKLGKSLAISSSYGAIKVNNLSVQNSWKNDPGLEIIGSKNSNTKESRIVILRVRAVNNGRGIVAQGRNITASLLYVAGSNAGKLAFYRKGVAVDFDAGVGRTTLSYSGIFTTNTNAQLEGKSILLRGKSSIAFYNNTFKSNRGEVYLGSSLLHNVKNNFFDSNITEYHDSGLYIDTTVGDYETTFPYTYTVVDHNRFINNKTANAAYSSLNHGIINISGDDDDDSGPPLTAYVVMANNIVAKNIYSYSDYGAILIDRKFSSNTAYKNVYRSYTSIVNNTISGNRGVINGGVYLRSDNNASTSTFYNNIIYANTAGPIHPTRANLYVNNDANADGVASKITLKNNNLSTFEAVIPALKDNTNININPLFVDVANNNYHIKSTSPMINKGINITATNPFYQTDIDGQSRRIGTFTDIGADEYRSSGGII